MMKNYVVVRYYAEEGFLEMHEVFHSEAAARTFALMDAKSLKKEINMSNDGLLYKEVACLHINKDFLLLDDDYCTWIWFVIEVSALANYLLIQFSTDRFRLETVKEVIAVNQQFIVSRPDIDVINLHKE